MRPRDPALVAVSGLLARQDGVVSRAQLTRAGARPHDLQRLLRRRELTPVHVGVFVDHTGVPTWSQAAWAAVLACGPGALAGESALLAHEGGRSGRRAGPLEVAVPWERRVVLPGVRVERRRDFDRIVRIGSPPRLRVEDAVVDVAARAASELDAVAELSQAVQLGLTTPDRLLACLAGRPRVRRRSLLQRVLEDVAGGTNSLLEHLYLVRVERAHGLPAGTRQRREVVLGGVGYRDVRYEPYGVIIELDGRLHHDAGAGRERDFDRDLEAAAQGSRTGRVCLGQTLDRACWTATQVATLLRRSGWPGDPQACPGCPPTLWA